MDLQKEFAELDKLDEFLKFDKIENPIHPSSDICAFLMLRGLVPSNEDIVVGAEHDQIWLDVNCEKLAEIVTKEQLRDLVRCGVLYDEDEECLFMFA